MLRKIVAGTLMAALLMILPFTAQANSLQSGTTIFDVGVSIGMWLIPGYTLPTMGGVVSGSLGSGLGIRGGYQHAGVGILGVELLRIDVFDLNAVFDLSPRDKFGVYFMGGGAFLLASALTSFGEGTSGAGISAGIGMRLQPMKSMKLFGEYRALVYDSVLHTLQVGMCMSF